MKLIFLKIKKYIRNYFTQSGEGGVRVLNGLIQNISKEVFLALWRKPDEINPVTVIKKIPAMVSSCQNGATIAK